MTATFFIDTNVVLYAASNAAADQPKRIIARQLLSEPNIGFSAQVLQEFYAVAVTKQCRCFPMLVCDSHRNSIREETSWNAHQSYPRLLPHGYSGISAAAAKNNATSTLKPLSIIDVACSPVENSLWTTYRSPSKL